MRRLADKIEEKYERLGQHDENHWNGIRQIVIYEGLMRKFSQNQDLKEKLKATGDTILAECAVKDCIWGIGLSMKDPDRLNRSKWKGQNLLGLEEQQIEIISCKYGFKL